MSADCHSLDANVLFYALDSSTGEKHDLAVQLWLGMRHRVSVLAVQTLAETYWAVHRKRPQDLTAARQFLTLAAKRLTIVSAQASDFLDASSIQASRPVRFWDALLASTLHRSGCRLLFTEDAQDRPESQGLLYVNPFQVSQDMLMPYLSR